MAVGGGGRFSARTEAARASTPENSEPNEGLDLLREVARVLPLLMNVRLGRRRQRTAIPGRSQTLPGLPPAPVDAHCRFSPPTTASPTPAVLTHRRRIGDGLRPILPPKSAAIPASALRS
jgi:hypothetical protein